MLSSTELDKAASQLADYRARNELNTIFDGYADLIQSFKRLKSDYEEEREGRERYKQLARETTRNPFVLVLIDGDGYIFNDAFTTAGSEGGSRAAKQLVDSVKASLRSKNLEDCEIMVRVYANVAGLSKHLSKNNLVGADKRSLAPFIAGFNRSYGLADFVDAGELKENADFKLKAMLRLYADNAQCKHIYFAACHDVGFVADLTPYRGHSDRLTMVRSWTVNFHDEFNKLGFNVEELLGVFRSNSLAQPANGPPSKQPSSAVATKAPSLTTNLSSSAQQTRDERSPPAPTTKQAAAKTVISAAFCTATRTTTTIIHQRDPARQRPTTTGATAAITTALAIATVLPPKCTNQRHLSATRRTPGPPTTPPCCQGRPTYPPALSRSTETVTA
jgi:hypothetical protein